jgi:hypothetical protein
MDFLWASLRGITRKPVVGATGLMFSPVASKLAPPDFRRAKAFRPKGGIEIVMLTVLENAGRGSETNHKRPADWGGWYASYLLDI